MSYIAGATSRGAVSVVSGTGTTLHASMFENASGLGELMVTGSKSFCTANPNDPKTNIWYACIEGPEAAIYVRGTATLVNGTSRVQLPEYFSSLASDARITVQVTPLSADSEGLAVVRKAVGEFEVREMRKGTGNYEFDYVVMAVRRGFEKYEVIRPVEYAQVQLPNGGTAK